MRKFHPMLCLALLLPHPTAAQANELQYFGYAGVACGLDDPHDATPKTDYIDEVAGFSNLNQVCVDADPGVTADRLKRMSAAGATPLLAIESVLFAQTEAALRPNPDRDLLWPLVQQGIAQSGLSPDQIVFYLVDEPTLRGLPMRDVSEAIRFLHQSYPGAKTMLVEAYNAAGPGPIPPELDFWGFDAYAVPDPRAEPLYTTYLNRARKLLAPAQQLVLLMDAMHTPTHAEAGISEAGMADVAHAYLALAQDRGDVAAILAYAWASGIDGPHEKGVRDLPAAVRAAHQDIGRAILAMRN
jgi:hypothetical protein